MLVTGSDDNFSLRVSQQIYSQQAAVVVATLRKYGLRGGINSCAILVLNCALQFQDDQVEFHW